mgnify:CR=1 FL=1|jgi:hypothetical protein|tara:strand:+ start:3578 stop:5443 length:1866 start_codon:yes stop_codon:yes gene_type:complete
MSNVFHEIYEAIRMGEGCVAVETEESQDVIEEIRGGVYGTNKQAVDPSGQVFVAFWDAMRGLQDINGDILSTVVQDESNASDLAALGMTPGEPEACSAFDAIKMFLDIADDRKRAAEEDNAEPSHDVKQVLVLRNFDRELMPQGGSVNSRLLMAVQHLITVGRMTDVMLVLMVGTGTELPPEIREHVAGVFHDLPDNDERSAIIEDLSEACGLDKDESAVVTTVAATSGLSRAWTERSVSEALSRYKSLDTGAIWRMKAEYLGKQGLLKLWTPEFQKEVKLWPAPDSGFESFADVTMLSEENHQQNREVPEGNIRARLRYSDSALIKEHWIDPMPAEEFEAKFRPERDFFSFKSVIGLHGLKEFLTRGNRAGVPDRAKMKGVLLVGVPGTGKSFIMKCAAGELGMPLSEMSAANLYSKWLGETDKNLRKMLTTVEQIGGILGIDEYQRFMPTGSSESEGRTSQSVAGGMLTWQNDQNSVLVLAAANDVSAIPPEFTRSGRFDTTYFVGFPSQEAKATAWEMYISRHELDEQKIPKDEYWTPADIEVCCKMSEQQGISLKEAAKYIKISYSGTGKKVLDDLMDWAENAGCIDAETNELFVHPRKQKSKAASKMPKRTVRSVK